MIEGIPQIFSFRIFNSLALFSLMPENGVKMLPRKIQRIVNPKQINLETWNMAQNVSQRAFFMSEGVPQTFTYKILFSQSQLWEKL